MLVPSTLEFHTKACPSGTLLPLLPLALSLPLPSDALQHTQKKTGHEMAEALPALLPVGTLLYDAQSPTPMFEVVGRSLWPGISRPCPMLLALRDIEHENACKVDTAAPKKARRFALKRQGYAVACITLSDKGWLGEREDRSGPALLQMTQNALPVCHSQLFLLPDEPDALRALALELIHGHGYDLLLTCGGTGLSPRDLSPEALLPLLSRRLPGLEQAMMQASLAKTPHAALSRALAGTIGQSLLLALPGSLRGATENLEAILPALPHALEKIAGAPSDCGG